MQIRAALLPELAGDVTNAVCIVIDVLRATTVVATLFDRQCPVVYAASSHDIARQFARQRGYTLCGETQGFRVEDFDYGNSPVEFSKLDFANKPAVISTTNGTRAIAAVKSARNVLLGAAVNRAAVASAAWRIATESQSDIVVVCSGTDGQFTLEDATVAGLYVEYLAGHASAWETPDLADSAIACCRLWRHEPYLLRSWMEGVHARNLGDRGFGEDLGFCAAIDVMEHVPVLVAEEDVSSVAAPVVLAT